MNPFDYIYFSLLKKQIEKKDSKYDDPYSKAGFINGLFYWLFAYNIIKLCGLEYSIKWLVITFTFALLPLIIYGFAGRDRLFKKYRSVANGGSLIRLAIVILILTSIFVWNMDVVNSMIFGDDLS